MLNDKPPEDPQLFVPDLDRPAGAAVAADGTAPCVVCRRRSPVATMDVVGRGHRCAACSCDSEVAALTTGRSDIDQHLSRLERHDMTASATRLIGMSALAIIGGSAALFLTLRGGAVVVGGFVGVIVGFARLRHAQGRGRA